MLLASIHHLRGDYAAGESFGRRALELNPNDPETLVQVGRWLAVRGNFEEGIPLIERAIASSVNPPGWYFYLLAIDHYMRDQPARMLEVAEHASLTGGGFSHFLVAIGAGALGDAEKAATALEKMAAQPSLAADPEAFLRRHGCTDEIVAKMMAGYEEARSLASTVSAEATRADNS